jgi:hypothetical protein
MNATGFLALLVFGSAVDALVEAVLKRRGAIHRWLNKPSSDGETAGCHSWIFRGEETTADRWAAVVIVSFLALVAIGLVGAALFARLA